MSDGNVLRTAPARRHASLQIPFNRPTLAIGLETGAKPSRICSFLARCRSHRACHAKPHPNARDHQFLMLLTCEGALRHNSVHFLDSPTSKCAPNMTCFCHFHFEMCFAPSCCSTPAALASLLFDHPEPVSKKKKLFRDVSALSRSLIFFLLTLSLLCLFLFWLFLFWLVSSVSFFALTVPTTVAASVHKSEVWLLGFLR